MKLTSLSCTQFAGIREKQVTFDSGINVICGDNESGKSTLVNLLSRTLFQNAKLDNRTDKEFRDLYFPGARKGRTVTGDFADGVLTLETDNGTYKLTKEWGKEPRCQLSTPDGVIRDQATVDAVLREVLGYGEGVYAELLFSSQRNTALSLQTLLDAAKKSEAKQDIADAVTMAFAQSDGVSVDAIEAAVAAKIDELMGKHWDVERGIPARKAGGGRHQKQLGEVLTAYYALEDAKAVLAEISRLEADADSTAAAYTAAHTAAVAAEEAHNTFARVAGQLTVQSERRKTIARLQAEQQKYAQILADWPRRTTTLEQANALQTAYAERRLWDTYGAAKQLSEELHTLESLIAAPCPTADELTAVKQALRRKNTLQNALCGMNLQAVVQMFGNHTPVIRSLRTGERLSLDNGQAAITEAVCLTVDGVMSLTLSPADVDTAQVQQELAALDKMIQDILSRYRADSLEALEQAAQQTAAARMAYDTANSRLSMLLAGRSFEELNAAVEGMTAPVRDKAALERELTALCGGTDAARLIAATEVVIEGYVQEHGSINELKIKAFDLAEELRRMSEAADAETLPAELARIADPEAHLEQLAAVLRVRQSEREAALTAKTAAASRLESYKETLTGDPLAEADKAARLFEDKQTLLGHWLHIAQVFAAQKEQLADNPMQEIADRFTRYLAALSDGKVASEFPEADKLQMTIYSDDRVLDYAKLSEGTKETVSLAFRLAVLDHLFPDGGGIIVLDDPLTDMDAARTARSCALIKDCAARHQVIFLTCKEELCTALGGHCIRM